MNTRASFRNPIQLCWQLQHNQVSWFSTHSQTYNSRNNNQTNVDEDTSWKHSHAQQRKEVRKRQVSFNYFASLKYKIRMIAMTRTATIEPIIHLFLLILLDMFVKILLLFPTLSSTPWSWTRRKKPSDHVQLYIHRQWCLIDP